LNTLADNAIMLKVKQGDLDKMTLLFERHHRSLYAFLFHMTYRREASEDMVQNVFYRMLKYRHTFTGEGEFNYWMFSIARNVLHEYHRKNKNHVNHSNVDDMQERIGGGISADAQLERKQAHTELYKAMERLSDDHREILTMSRFQELKYQEIGTMLGISEGAVKVRVHRAMCELKSIYTKMER
jgi:RNA polymerase sigma factor (sigma-70 family)